jgi:hypothetical protein
MLEGNLRGQSRMDNPEKLATTATNEEIYLSAHGVFCLKGY